MTKVRGVVAGGRHRGQRRQACGHSSISGEACYSERKRDDLKPLIAAELALTL